MHRILYVRTYTSPLPCVVAAAEMALKILMRDLDAMHFFSFFLKTNKRESLNHCKVSFRRLKTSSYSEEIHKIIPEGSNCSFGF